MNEIETDKSGYNKVHYFRRTSDAVFMKVIYDKRNVTIVKRLFLYKQKKR